ncbi:hypothetical protein RU98_GL002982 [Enterococcus caccae]|nr:hypothetical protein RU98_GL002982 [Enterococcus caccae]
MDLFIFYQISKMAEQIRLVLKNKEFICGIIPSKKARSQFLALL